MATVSTREHRASTSLPPGPATRTPVLSARRVPELIAAPAAARRLRSSLDAWVAQSPPDRCLAVADSEGDVLYAHRESAPLVPASTIKLLTAAGLLLTFEPEHRFSPDSPSVSEMVARMLRDSHRPSADLALQQLGGASELREILAEADIDLEGVSIGDGSGFALDNRVPCRVLVSLLTHPTVGSALIDDLAVAGESGTLRGRFVGSPVQDLLRAKTGSLRTVTALAGVMPGARPVVFAYVLNVPGRAVTPEETALQDRLAAILHEYARASEVTELGPR
jgi:D-alanyl-D-alanine carboxypeptidase/D-alanyl-D-alanine-endopeptidase (penicillin-binding protein 4)